MAKDGQHLCERALLREVARAILDFDLIGEGDHILVAVSGGKDSYSLLHLLERLRTRSPVKFELTAVHIDQGQPGYDGRPLEQYLVEHGYPHRIVREDTYSVVVDKLSLGDTYCWMCSRLRRGVLYSLAREMGCTKIALGHHRDDAIETLMLNLLFAGQLKAMPPKLVSDDGDNVIIRPLVYCPEADLAEFAERTGFPLLPCNLCGSQADLKRKEIKKLLSDLEDHYPAVRSIMLAALTNVRPSHLLDARLWRELGLQIAKPDDDVRAAVSRERRVRLPIAGNSADS